MDYLVPSTAARGRSLAVSLVSIVENIAVVIPKDHLFLFLLIPHLQLIIDN